MTVDDFSKWVLKTKLVVGITISYEVRNGSIILIKVIGNAREFVIPDCVTIINSRCFEFFDCDKIVVLSDTCTIYSNCFNNMHNLKCFVCNNIRLYDSAFYLCRSLVDFQCKSVEFKGSYCFEECKNLSSFDFSKIKGNNIPTNCFTNCGFVELDLSKLEYLFLGYMCFSSNFNLKCVKLPLRFSSYGRSFRHCIELKELEINDISIDKNSPTMYFCENCSPNLVIRINRNSLKNLKNQLSDLNFDINTFLGLDIKGNTYKNVELF